MNIDAPKKEDYPALRALWREAFGEEDSFLDAFWQTAFSPFRCRLVRKEDTVAAALYWLDCTYQGEKIAYLYAIATGKRYRAQGLCRALMEDTHEHLKALGYLGALLVPSEPSLFAFYEKMGYRTASRICELRAERGGEPAPLRALDAKAYAAKRVPLLPKGHVAEGEAFFALLKEDSAFYEGNGFLLAARKEKERLFGLELLGDTAAAPAILNALDCEVGIFRTVGTETPFSMYLPFGRTASSSPEYFAFALD